MGERIKDRMNRLYAEYQQERQAATSPPSTAPASESEGAPAPRTQVSRENIDAPASPDELRKARTRRLIQTGALCDQYLGTCEMTPEQVMALLGRISKLEGVKEILGGETVLKRGADERNL